jgi:uncharacterized RDD family membrane protein YckC
LFHRGKVIMAESTDAAQEAPPEDLDLGRPAELEYAGFWSRVAALIVDNAIVTIFGVALLIAASGIGAEAVLIANLAYIVIAILYWPLLESSERQATVGKQLMGIQVVDANGARLSFVRALLRNLAKILSSLPFGLGFVLAAFTPKKQALHDMVTKCLVVRAGPSNFRKAVIAAVGALVITIAGSYYYFTEVYQPRMAEEVGREMQKGMKQVQKGVPVAKAPAPAAAQPAPGTPKVMTPEELAAFEKKVAEARREPAKVAAAPSPDPGAQPKPAAPAPAKPAVTEAKPAPAKPAPAVKEAAPKPAAPPAAVAKPEPKPESKPVAVAAAKPTPKPAAAPADMPKPPPPVATAPLVSEPPAAPPARPAEPAAPAAPRAPAAVTVVAPLTGIVRSPKFNDIMTAVMFRDPKAVSELLEYGWWVDRRDSNGLTPLMAAAWNGDAAMTQILLKAGADPNRYARGGSVLDYAGRGENAQVIELLKRSGAR